MTAAKAKKKAWRNDRRIMVLDATERLMVKEGYAAVTTRRVASEVGVTPGVVHYYFPTTEDLLLATYRRAAEQKDERVRIALASECPIRALWESSVDTKRMALALEIVAMSNHRKFIRREIARHTERSRRLQTKALSTALNRTGVDSKICPPVAVAVLLDAVSRGFVMEEVLGVSYGRSETSALVTWLIRRLEDTRGRTDGASKISDVWPLRRRRVA